MNDDVDPYARLAAEQISAPAKARLRAAKTREERRIAKQLSDREILQQQWRAWHDKQIKKLMKGCHAEAVRTVATFLESMMPEDGNKLIELIERGPWRKADSDSRYLLLSLIDARMICLRLNEGMPPFDDSIPFTDESPTVFEIIREMLQ